MANPVPETSPPALWDEDAVLRAIAEGTSSVVGEDYFRSLVFHLAQALGVKLAFVAEFTDVRTRVRTLAFWDGTGIHENIEFDLAGTPCEDVVLTGLCHHPKDVSKLFPKDEGLVAAGAESYLGVPLLDSSGEVMGHLAVIDTHPMAAEPRYLSVFKIFAARARAELERLNLEKAVAENRERLAGILESAMDAIIVFDSDLKTTILNPAAERLFQIQSERAIGASISPFLTESFMDLLKGFLRALSQDVNASPTLWFPEGLNAVRTNGEEFAVEATVSQSKVNRQVYYTLILRDINDRKKAEKELQKLRDHNIYLQEEIADGYPIEEIIGRGPNLQEVLKNVELVAATDSSVLITGETGTGKELIARKIHDQSGRKDKPLIKVNCAGIPEGLVESEFFGHEKGAFTGATARRIGRFELAHGGTIFLDEIGEVPLDMQAKLLRVLQEKEFERVGGSKTIKVDVRVIAATNRDLESMVQERFFRDDLFFRLNVFPISVPPLRDRKEDIPLLVHYFVQKFSSQMGKRIEKVSKDTMEQFLDYHWPGNIRELINVIERAVILTTGPNLNVNRRALFQIAKPAKESDSEESMADAERRHVRGVLEKTNWVVEGPKGAARLLNVQPSTLRSRMKKLGLSRD